MARQIKIHDMQSIRDSLSNKKRNRLKAKLWNKIFHTSGNEKKPMVARVIPDKRDFKSKAATRKKK